MALWKDHGCDYLELQPLSVEETGVLVESVVGGDVDGPTRHRLWERAVACRCSRESWSSTVSSANC